MLQRIQTLWVLLSVLLASSFFFISWEASACPPFRFPVPGLMAAFLVPVGLVSIFSYKHRRRQLLLNKLSMLASALLMSFLVYCILNTAEQGSGKERVEVFLPLVSIGALFLANIRIRKDEELVRSADRIR